MLLIAALCSCWFIAAMAQPDEPAVQFDTCSTLDAGSSIVGNQQLLDTAHSAILFELNTNTMVYSWNPDQSVDPSGMNKIMTALLALEQGDLEDQVLVSNVALSSVEIGALTVGLAVGEEMTLEDLLYCMMVGSANDAAAVIAEHIAGGQAAFVDLMNQKAVEIGCTNTVFMNPSGLSHENQRTTARDLAKITAAALEQEEFLRFFSATEHTVAATNKSQERALVTTNHMMTTETMGNFFDERVTGGKTGAFTTTDRSLICTAQSGDAKYLSVVMSAQGEKGTTTSPYANFRETSVLLEQGFSKFSSRRLLTSDLVLERFEVTNGENDLAVSASSEVHVMMPKDMNEADLTYRCIKTDAGVSAPISAGQVVGTVQVWYGSLCVTQGELVAMHGVAQPGTYNVAVEKTPLATDDASSSNTAITIILIPVGLILVIGIVIILYRKRNRNAYRKQGKRRR